MEKQNQSTIQNVKDYASLGISDQSLIQIQKKAGDLLQKNTAQDSDFFKRDVILPGVPVVLQKEHKNDKREVSGLIKIKQKQIEISLDETHPLMGVEFCDLLTAMRNFPQFVSRAFEKNLNGSTALLSILNLYQSVHGAFLHIPQGVRVEDPFVVEIDSSGIENVFPIYLIIRMEAASAAKISIRITGNLEDSTKKVITIVTQIELSTNAELKIFEEQRCDQGSNLSSNSIIDIGQNAKCNYFIHDLGASELNRSLFANNNAPGAEAVITGIYEAKNSQKFSFDTVQNHTASHTTSDLLFKGVLGGASSALWKGNIYVAADTIGVDGFQKNNNLMISENAKAESIPGLEILADDVRCSHGVTIGNVDKNQMFYLQSRGINKEEAKSLIIQGFLDSAFKRLDYAIKAKDTF